MVFSQNTLKTTPAQFNGRHIQAGHRDKFDAEGNLRPMANTTSAKKATRKIARRTIINKSRRTQMRN
jgi:hypothetical protein